MSDTSGIESVAVTIDDREERAGLIELVSRAWVSTRVGRLPVGDVEIGQEIIIERKTVADFVVSLNDGRLFDQACRLSRVANRPLIIIEGEDTIAVADLEPKALRGVLLALMVGFRIPVLRTGSAEETAENVVHLARRETKRRSRRSKDPGKVSRSRLSMQVLTSVPGVGDERARRLVNRLGSTRGVFLAEEDALRTVDGVGSVIAKTIRRAGDGDQASE